MPLPYILYKPLGALEAGGDRGGGVGKDIETCSFSILVLKRKKIFLGLYFFSRGNFFQCECGSILPRKIVINMPRAFEKLHCKRKPYQFSGERDLSEKRDTRIIY